MESKIHFEILKSNRKNKRFVGIFYNIDDFGNLVIIKKTHFGQQGGSTYIDHNDDVKKANYIKRHQVNENWDDPFSAGSLSRFLLWENKTLSESIKNYKKRFNFV